MRQKSGPAKELAEQVIKTILMHRVLRSRFVAAK